MPALAIVGELAYLICATKTRGCALFNAGAVMLGFASHLVLDEIWSIDFSHLRLKSSFGTAIKFWGDCWWANLATYANVILLALLMLQDPAARPRFARGPQARHDRQAAGRSRPAVMRPVENRRGLSRLRSPRSNMGLSPAPSRFSDRL